MKEVKTPKKPLAIYYTVVLLVLLLLNLVLVPWMSERQVKEVDYASRASKKAPQGLFSPPDCSASRCCSHPPL